MKLHIFFTMLLVILTTGCSFFESSTQLVAINVTPRDATVIANGLAYTGSPMFIEIKRSKELMLLIYKPGYESQSYVVGNHLSTSGILDACGSIFIVPLFALTTNGAWALDETNLRFVLKPLPPEKEIAEAKAAAITATITTTDQPDQGNGAENDDKSLTTESAEAPSAPPADQSDATQN